MPDHFEYIECWADDTIDKPPWGKSCPAGQSCNDNDNNGDRGSGSSAAAFSVGDPSKKGLSKDATLTIILCCTLIPLVLGIGVLVQKRVDGGWGAVARGAKTGMGTAMASIRQRLPAKLGGT
jgi:hypothetical protein